MPNAFNFAASPFDALSSDEQQLVRDHVDIAYFPEGETVLAEGDLPTHLFVVIKGLVSQFDDDEVITTYHAEDTFDGRSLMTGKVNGRFVATEEVVAYQLAKQAVVELIASNATFGALLFSDLSKKLAALAERQSQHELQALTIARVSEAFVREAVFVSGDTDVYSVVQTLKAHKTSNVLVHDNATSPPRLGIFTTTGLQDAILHPTPLRELKVSELASFPVISVKPDDYVFDALIAMIHHRVHRVVVQKGEDVVGVLEQLDLLGFLSNHSHLITVQVSQATSLEGLEQAAAQINRLIALLLRGGTKVEMIARLVQELNAKLFERAWCLIAPADLVANSCLFVMGSEGRGEQLLKTDQDNGLVWRDGYLPPENLAEICDAFSQALASFGYPPCPGHIMLSNPNWRADQTQFSQTVRRWLAMPDAENLMALAIFIDAHAVCGNAKLLETVRDEVYKLAGVNDVLQARFAAAIDSFALTTGWWNRILGLGLDEQGRLNLKKAGIFALVHGVRSMALEQRLRATSTVARIAALVEMGKLPSNVGAELTGSLHFFMGLKLRAGLQELEKGQGVTGLVEVAKLDSLDRDLLKDSLGAVKRFKSLLRHRYHLDAM